MASPSGDDRDKLRTAAAEQVNRWETVLADQLASLWARQEGVVLARLQGTKARRATRHWTPAGAKQLDPSYILDPARWLLEAINAARDVMLRLFRSVVDSALARYGVTSAPPPAPPGVTPTMPGQGSQHGDTVPSPAAPAPAPSLVPDPVLESAVEARLQTIGQAVVAASKEVQEAITNGEEAGKPMDQIADDVRRVYTTRKEQWTQGIVATHVVGSLNESSLIAAQAAGVGHKQWLSSHDDRVRPSHRHADGQVVDIGDRFVLDTGTLAYPGDTTGPIAEWINCFPGDAEVEAASALGVTRRWYVGTMISVTTDSGRVLTGTPNHPVLTAAGWTPLHQLAPGDDLVCGTFGQRVPLGHPHVQDRPARFEEVFAASAADAGVGVGMVGRPVDFHGDGRATEVEVVPIYGLLRERGDAAVCEPALQVDLAATDVLPGRRAGAGASRQLVGAAASAADGVMGGLSVGGALLGGARGGKDSVCLGASAGGDAAGSEGSGERWPSYSEVASELRDGGAGEVALDGIVEVRVTEDWSGHVFNLHTQEGYYIANGIIAHNCRCTMLFPMPQLGQPVYDPAMFAPATASAPA